MENIIKIEKKIVIPLIINQYFQLNVLFHEDRQANCNFFYF